MALPWRRLGLGSGAADPGQWQPGGWREVSAGLCQSKGTPTSSPDGKWCSHHEFCPRERSPLFQRSCLDTHQCVIKLKSTDVVGWDVGCSQRLRNLSDNSTFICGEDKNSVIVWTASLSLTKLPSLASSMPHRIGLLGPPQWTAHLILLHSVCNREYKSPKGIKHQNWNDFQRSKERQLMMFRKEAPKKVSCTLNLHFLFSFCC